MFQNKLHLSKHKCNGFCALLVPTNLIIGPVISRAQGRVSIIRRVLPGEDPLPWPLSSDQDDPGPLSLCVRFQVISRGGIVNGMVTQLWRIWSSQCLFFSAEMVQHQSQTFYRNVLLMFTNHRPPCWQRLNITDKTRSYRVSMSGCHYAPLAIVTRLICLICLIVPDLVLTHSPLSSPQLRAPSLTPHGTGRRSNQLWVRRKTENPTVPPRTLHL